MNSDYIKVEQIKGNSDLHIIARKIGFENGLNYIQKDISRKEFVELLITEAEWYLDMVSPPSNKFVIEDSLKELLKIQENEKCKDINIKSKNKTERER